MQPNANYNLSDLALLGHSTFGCRASLGCPFGAVAGASLGLLLVRSLRSLVVRSLRSLIAFVMDGFLASPVGVGHFVEIGSFFGG